MIFFRKEKIAVILYNPYMRTEDLEALEAAIAEEFGVRVVCVFARYQTPSYILKWEEYA